MNTAPKDLESPELYLNRELSLLEFDARVLEQARDPRVPLLERVRFLSISSTNLDEFYEIRVSGLKQKAVLGVATGDADGLTPRETLQRISTRAHELVAEQYRVLNEDLLPSLEAAGIRLLKRADWSPAVRRWCERHFHEQVQPVLTPMGLDPAHPFPRLLNKSLNFVVSVEGPDDFDRDSGIAVVQAPRSLPRLIHVPPDVSEGPHDFVLLSSIVHAHMDQVFPGMEIKDCSQFRLTRNSDLWVDEEEIDDLLRAVQGELPRRNFGDAVRLEVAANCPAGRARFLLSVFKLEESELFRVDGPVNLNRISALHALADRPDLKYVPFRARVPKTFEVERDIFAAIRAGDALLHHPYESFSPVVELVRQAAKDPDVLAIKQTLYRTSSDSPIVAGLVEAARAGKEVTVVVELRARFDEAANIAFATRLQEAGAAVIYGIVGRKTHAKMLMVVRRERGQLVRYVHLGTGNYHSGTASAYTDIGLFTHDPVIASDVHKMFTQLTGMGRVGALQKLVHSPFTLHDRLIEAIDREARAASEGRPARIIAKMNALTEPRIIRALYAASRAGVPIDLIVRGICCLRPGVPGVSDNIRVRSIIGRFLEHSRIFYFQAEGEGELWCASADWMQRNFFSRVELSFPIDDRALRARVYTEGLELYLTDDAQSWLLQSDGKYVRHVAAEQPRSAQARLLAEICGLPEAQPEAQRRDGQRLRAAAPVEMHREPQEDAPPRRRRRAE